MKNAETKSTNSKSVSSSFSEFSLLSGGRTSRIRRPKKGSDEDDKDFVADSKEWKKIEMNNEGNESRIIPRTIKSSISNSYMLSYNAEEESEEESIDKENNYDNNFFSIKSEKSVDQQDYFENDQFFESTSRIEHIFLSRESDQGLEYLVTFQETNSPFAQWILAAILSDFNNFPRMLKKFNETEMNFCFYNTNSRFFDSYIDDFKTKSSNDSMNESDSASSSETKPSNQNPVFSFTKKVLPLRVISHKPFSEGSDKLEFLFQFDLETGTCFFWETAGQIATEKIIKIYLDNLVSTRSESKGDLNNNCNQDNNGNNESNEKKNRYNENTCYNELKIKIPKKLKIEYNEGDDFRSTDKQVPRNYQIDGVNWLLRCMHDEHGSILADEMGLGKTIQALMFLMKLNQSTEFRGPHLIAVRTNTFNQWCNEIERWCSTLYSSSDDGDEEIICRKGLKYIAYEGTPETRDLIRAFQFPAIDKNGRKIENSYGFNICLMTYDIVLKDSEILKNIDWQAMIVDEGHRIKNCFGKKHKAFISYKCMHRIILTGTPIQNTLQELYTLLNFVSPLFFQNENMFPEDDIESLDESVLKSLFLKISPHLMRRSLLSVEHSIIPKEERVAFLHMTNEQMELSRLNKLHELSRITSLMNKFNRSKDSSNNNSFYDTQSESSINQRICNHPFLVNGAENYYTKRYPKLNRLKLLLKCSSKFMFLDKILPIIKERKRSVLLFSQRLKTLKLLQEYCQLRKYQSVMLIGEMNESEKDDAIKQFCDPKSKVFIFLISTRSGSEGLNLTKASFTIIFDPDWNPQNDLQAQARCHRIGQTQKVDVLRLITYGSYEHEMFSRAQRKLSLWLSLFGDGSQQQVTPPLQKALKNNDQKLNDNNCEQQKFDSMINPIKSYDTTELEANLLEEKISISNDTKNVQENGNENKTDANKNEANNDEGKSAKIFSESTIEVPPLINKKLEEKRYDVLNDVLKDFASIVTEEEIPTVSQQQIPIQDISMDISDDNEFLSKFPSKGNNYSSISSSPSFSSSKGKNKNESKNDASNGSMSSSSSICYLSKKKGRPSYFKVNFDAKTAKLLVLKLEYHGYGNWDKIYEIVDDQLCTIEQLIRFCQSAILLYFRACDPSRISCFPFLIKTLLNDRPDFDFQNFFCNDTAAEWFLRGEVSICKQIRGHIFKSCFNFLSVLEYHLILKEFISQKLVLDFNQLPPSSSYSNEDNKGIYHNIINNEEFSLINSKLFNILNLMKTELIKNYDILNIREKVMNFPFWTKSEVDSILSMIRNFGNQIRPEEIHFKSGLLSKNTQQVQFFSFSLLRFLNMNRHVSLIIPESFSNLSQAPIPVLKEPLSIDATDISIAIKRICLFSLMKSALIKINTNAFNKIILLNFKDHIGNGRGYYGNNVIEEGENWLTINHCRILLEQMTMFGLDNLTNILLSPDLCFVENLTKIDIDFLLNGNARIFEEIQNIHKDQENQKSQEKISRLPSFLLNDTMFYNFLKKLCGINNDFFQENVPIYPIYNPINYYYPATYTENAKIIKNNTHNAIEPTSSATSASASSVSAASEVRTAATSAGAGATSSSATAATASSSSHQATMAHNHLKKEKMKKKRIRNQTLQLFIPALQHLHLTFNTKTRYASDHEKEQTQPKSSRSTKISYNDFF